LRGARVEHFDRADFSSLLQPAAAACEKHRKRWNNSRNEPVHGRDEIQSFGGDAVAFGAGTAATLTYLEFGHRYIYRYISMPNGVTA
jgi:hypothetical protein